MKSIVLGESARPREVASIGLRIFENDSTGAIIIFMKQVTLISDGACVGNPGPGGWAYILRYAEHSVECAGGASDTTNNRMDEETKEGAGEASPKCRPVAGTRCAG